jgi:pyruvate kinase
MKQTCVEAESAQNTNMLYQAVRNSTLEQYGVLSTSESIASSAVKTAIDVHAKAIIVCSESGMTATQVAKFRPGVPILCLTLTDRVARQVCGVLRSATAKVLSGFTELDKDIDTCLEGMKDSHGLKAGDAVIVITGTIHHKGCTNLMRVQYVV